MSKRSDKPARTRGNTLLGIFVGIVIGTLGALIVVWAMNRSPSPFVNKAQLPPDAGAKAAEPAPLPAKPGDPPAQNRFEFYDILQGKSTPQPAKAPAAGSAGETKSAARTTAPESGDYYLQAGSFQTAKDAENFRASLALMGMEASIQPATVEGKQWYRVRLGPYTQFEEARKARVELAKGGIEAELRRGKN
jgi:cell division protein FtsN